jgi:uncharacterized membrane protein YqjE
MATAIREERSIGQLLRALAGEIATLVRQEIALAKVEASEAAARVGASLGELAIGGAVLFAGALAVLAAVVLAVAALLYLWLSPTVANWLAPAVVGIALTAVGLVMVRQAIDRLKHAGIVPRKTTQTLQENKEWLQARIQ